MPTREELINQIDDFLTLEDVIEVALASIPQTKFSADSHNWTKAFYELWNQFHQQIPEFDTISFSFRPPLPPPTKEAYQTITTLAMAGRVGLPNPRLHKVIMTNAVKKRILREKQKVQGKYKDYLPKIAQILQDNLCKS
jgi:hypothetical protein